MNALTSIPVALNRPALLQRLHVTPGSEDAIALERLISRAFAVAAPKALYADVFVGSRGNDTVEIEGITFRSRLLRQRLDGVARVFPFVATCGHELDEVPLPADDLLAQFWWDAIKAELLSLARAYLLDHLTATFRLPKTARMSPGSGDADVWPIEQQRELFALLDGVTRWIGVRLTDSCLMLPNKTVSGIVFPTEEDFRTCEVCHREACPNRSAPFDEVRWRLARQA